MDEVVVGGLAIILVRMQRCLDPGPVATYLHANIKSGLADKSRLIGHGMQSVTSTMLAGREPQEFRANLVVLLLACHVPFS